MSNLSKAKIHHRQTIKKEINQCLKMLLRYTCKEIITLCLEMKNISKIININKIIHYHYWSPIKKILKLKKLNKNSKKKPKC